MVNRLTNAQPPVKMTASPMSTRSSGTTAPPRTWVGVFEKNEGTDRAC